MFCGCSCAVPAPVNSPQPIAFARFVGVSGVRLGQMSRRISCVSRRALVAFRGCLREVADGTGQIRGLLCFWNLFKAAFCSAQSVVVWQNDFYVLLKQKNPCGITSFFVLVKQKIVPPQFAACAALPCAGWHLDSPACALSSFPPILLLAVAPCFPSRECAPKNELQTRTKPRWP